MCLRKQFSKFNSCSWVNYMEAERVVVGAGSKGEGNCYKEMALKLTEPSNDFQLNEHLLTSVSCGVWGKQQLIWINKIQTFLSVAHRLYYGEKSCNVHNNKTGYKCNSKSICCYFIFPTRWKTKIMIWIILLLQYLSSFTRLFFFFSYKNKKLTIECYWEPKTLLV